MLNAADKTIDLDKTCHTAKYIILCDEKKKDDLINVRQQQDLSLNWADQGYVKMGLYCLFPVKSG